MKCKERIMIALSAFIFILMPIIAIGFTRIETELEATINENNELKKEIEELEKENYALNFEKSLERTCGLSTVECNP